MLKIDHLSQAWQEVIQHEMRQPYFKLIERKLLHDIEFTKKTIYPDVAHIFKAFEYGDPNDVKVVILGQDPYYNAHQAMGLAFSVPKAEPIPPSLKNIFKELKDDIGIENSFGDLTTWAKQGVLLLNSSLTVEEGKPGSHSSIGWTIFTDNIIRHLNLEEGSRIFVLWGNYAKAKRELINENKHFVITAAHPSPLSCKGFFETKPFSQINNKLISLCKDEIDWRT